MASLITEKWGLEIGRYLPHYYSEGIKNIHPVCETYELMFPREKQEYLVWLWSPKAWVASPTTSCATDFTTRRSL